MHMSMTSVEGQQNSERKEGTAQEYVRKAWNRSVPAPADECGSASTRDDKGHGKLCRSYVFRGNLSERYLRRDETKRRRLTQPLSSHTAISANTMSNLPSSSNFRNVPTASQDGGGGNDYTRRPSKGINGRNRNYAEKLEIMRKIKEEEANPPTDIVTTADATVQPEGKRKTPAYVTTVNPFKQQFTKLPQYLHTNSRNDHRQNRPEHQNKGGRPCTVNEFIDRCQRNGITEVWRWQRLYDDPDHAPHRKENIAGSRQEAWSQKWAHSGRNGYAAVAVQPSDLNYVHTVEEVEYQRRLGSFLGDIDRNRRTYYPYVWSDVPKTLPRPMTEWYMFDEEWVEDAIF